VERKAGRQAGMHAVRPEILHNTNNVLRPETRVDKKKIKLSSPRLEISHLP